MVESKPNPDAFRHIDDPQVVWEVFKLEKYRADIKKNLHDATFLNGKINLEEHHGLQKLLQSDDRETLYLAESIIKCKTDE